jgi:AcrR family transcriptional regulator
MMSPPPRAPGRREANKDAVRTALRDAARDLFAQNGYEATTVREIAAAANVTDRTFYRYFDGKEGLLAEEVLGWVESLGQAIRERPADEPPLHAAIQGMRQALTLTRDGSGAVHLWMFSNRPRPFAAIRRFSPRPLVRLEQAITKALQARAAAVTPGTGSEAPSSDSDFTFAVLARVAVAALRSAVIHSRDLTAAGDADPAGQLDATLLQTLAIIGAHAPELEAVGRWPDPP